MISVILEKRSCKKNMKSLPITFTDRKISPWGGIHMFHSIYEKTKLRELLSDLPLPSEGSNRSYDVKDVIESFLVSVVLGSKRLAHSGMLRSDEVIHEIFKWKQGSPSESTYSRFFKRFTIATNDAVFPAIKRHLFSQVAVKKMTIDIDSTVITRYGHQEGAEKGYNDKDRGKRSHHPVLAFCDEVKMVINAWMRSGHSSSGTDMAGFLDEMFTIVSRSRIGLIRMDSGFYSDNIMRKLESTKEPVEYLIKARVTNKLREAIYEIDHWYDPEEGGHYQYGELEYRGSGWKSPRRIVVTRKPRQHDSGQGELFPGILEMESYDYYAFVTNSKHSCKVIHSLYNKRGDCENLIKELKYDYSIDGFALKHFAGMEAAFRLIMVAFNLMRMLQQKALTSKHKQRLSTIKFQCIALGSYVVKNGRNKMLKLSASGKRRHFLEKIFHNVELIPPNFKISNA